MQDIYLFNIYYNTRIPIYIYSIDSLLISIKHIICQHCLFTYHFSEQYALNKKVFLLKMLSHYHFSHLTNYISTHCRVIARVIASDSK